MKVLGCIGAGSFGKVLKVAVGEDVFAVKKVDVSLFRLCCNSTARMIVGKCNRSKSKPKY